MWRRLVWVNFGVVLGMFSNFLGVWMCWYVGVSISVGVYSSVLFFVGFIGGWEERDRE